ncbi:MAG: helix-turn-helix domain-containing protein [Candidatus Eiseniibacteriota bacterium]
MSTGQPFTTDRFGDWMDTVCRTYVALDATPADDTPFRAGIDVTHLGDTVFSELHATAQRVDRRPVDIARSTVECAIVLVQRAGTMVVAQDGRELVLTPGTATIVDTTRPYAFNVREPIRQIVVHCPLHRFSGRLRSMRAVTAARIARDSPTGALLAGTLDVLAGECGRLAPSHAEAVGRYVLDLIAVALEATPEGGAAVPSRGSAALLARLKAYVRENLADPALAPAQIAAAHGISVRHMHRLFHESGDSVGAAIRRGRLDRCCADLEDPRQRGRSVTEIALRWGFNDSAHFSRAFKARFGISPRTVRGKRPD